MKGMKDKMKAAIMTDLKKIEFAEIEVPEPKENEVLVKIEAVGICGSDLHYYENGRIGNFIVEPPFILGHEAAGTVVKMGKKATGLSIGDKVALEPGKTCGECEFCKTGRYNLCEKVEFFATPPVQGVFTEYTAHEAALCFKLPDNMDAVEGALIEPLAVGLHAVRQAGAQLGQTAVVMGAGCIGLVSLLSLKAAGVTKVIVVDIVDRRLDKAKELGADMTINGRTDDTVAKIMEYTEGRGFDIAIETAGTELTAGQLIQTAKKGAAIVFVGYSASDKMSLPVNMALDKELTMKTIFRYRNIYPAAIDAVASGRIKIKEIVTNTYAFDRTDEAMAECAENKEDIVKGVILLA